MNLSVKERGATVATFRYLRVALMETLAAWVPTTPEMEAKLVLGGHIWDAAQQADALGKRTLELRLPLQHSRRPQDAYVQLLDDIAAVRDTPRRLAAIYDVLLPALDDRMRQYLALTDHLIDAPTVRILDRILSDDARMIRESQALLAERPELSLIDRAWAESLAAAERAIATPVRSEEAAVAAGAS